MPWEKDLDIGVLREDLNESDIKFLVDKSIKEGYQVKTRTESV